MSNPSIKTALITGITGSGASYLADYLIHNHPDISLHGTTRLKQPSLSICTENFMNRVTYHTLDLLEAGRIKEVIHKVKPDVIFHMASLANVLESFKRPEYYLNNNIIGTVNLLEAIKNSNTHPVIQICSTSEVYGQVDPKNIPISETCSLNPVSPYAISKLAQDTLGYTYFKSYGLKVVRTRMFTYLNPRRKDLFATSFALQVARIEAGLQNELLHGNLDSIRTIIDVRDAVEAYWLATNHGKSGSVYNIGGDSTLTVGEFLEILKTKANVKIISKLDKALIRPSDVTLQIPDCSEFKKLCDWKPKYSFEESVAFLLEEARRLLKFEQSLALTSPRVATPSPLL